MNAMTRSCLLDVPAARLYHEVRGAGPTLLIIPGGPQDAGVFTELAERMAERYTVVTYDPRGNSRSSFTSPADAAMPLDIGQQADDAAALIETIGAPACVFGTSGGAQIGLNLAARHPRLVEALVAHEPPCMMLLDDPAPMLAADDALYETYRREGVGPAMAQFFASNGLDDDQAQGGDAAPMGEMPPQAAETFARVSGNFEYWLAHGNLPLSRFTPDVTRLHAGKPRVAVAIGAQSLGQPIHAMGLALARRLGLEPLTFPGDHMGFTSHTTEFAAALGSALGTDRPTTPVGRGS